MKPPHLMSLCFFKTHFNIPSFILKSSQWFHSSRFPHHNLILHLMTPVVFDKEYKPWNSSLCNTLHLPVTSSQTHVSALITKHCQPVFIAYCDTPSSTPTGKIIFLHITTFIFGDSKLEHKRFWTELWKGYHKFILLMISLCMHCSYAEQCTMFSVITNIYNKKTKGPILMELFTSTGKLKVFIDN
jgi:hypothetical protein